MKKCPTCGKTFNDGMRFCQLDGTLLVEESEDLQSSDSYKTVVSNQSDFGAETPEITKFNESSLNQPSFGNLSSPQGGFSNNPSEPEEDNLSQSTLVLDSKSIPDNYSSGYDSKPLPNNPPVQSSAPIPSPFENPTPAGYEPLPYKEPEPGFGGSPDSLNQSPFGQPQMPFGNASEPYNPPMQQGNWSPVSAAPVSDWQEQGFGANTAFQPPASAQGQNQTLAIVSLVLGVLSIPCCGSLVLGLGALTTGYLAKKKADENPSEYGGRNLALAGMIIGGITTVLGLIFIILQIFLGLFNNI